MNDTRHIPPAETKPSRLWPRGAYIACLTVLLLVLTAGTPVRAESCAWADDFVDNGLDGMAYALSVFDDGTGQALYVGGDFHHAGGQPHRRIARWDGQAWSPLGDGLPDIVRALIVFDDGSGPALYAAGRHFNGGSVGGYVQRWTGSQWQPLGQGFNDQVNTLTVYDDGSGPALFAGGAFSQADGVTARRLARWTGSHWQEYGGGITCEPISGLCAVHVLRAMPFYGSVRLFAGGRFTHAGGVAMNNANGDSSSPYIHWGNIGSWNGSRWFSMNGGLNKQAHAIAEFDDIANASSLRVGGDFDYGLSSMNYLGYVGVYQFAQFTPLHDGFFGWGVHALEVVDAGDGRALYAAGNLSGAPSTNPAIPSVSLRNIARWNGVHWQALGHGLFSETYALAQFDDGSGPALFAAGAFFAAGTVQSHRIAKWQCAGDLIFANGFQSSP